MSHHTRPVCVAVTCAGRRARGLALLCTALLLALGAPGGPSARAAPSAAIIVTTVADETANGDGCSLREAITNANNNAQTYSDCAAGSGADTITFSVSGTIVLGLALPAINDNLTVDGTGQSVTVSGNNAVQVLAVNGGKTLSLNRLTIVDGVGGDCGGSICGGGISNQGALTVNNSTFSGNRVPDSGYGGAIGNAGTLTVSNSTFSLNVVTSTFSCCVGDGGAIGNAGTLIVSSSTFSGNSAPGGYGGAIYNYSVTSLSVSNSTFSGSSAVGGGGIAVLGGTTAMVTNSTFSGNSASQSNLGTIYNAGTTTLKNTIVANSSSGGNCFGVITDGGHNLRWPNTDNSCVGAFGDPQLGPLANNGGPTFTNALIPGSPAIGWIPLGANGCGTTITSDQRGVGRPLGYRQGVPACSIGSYEVGELFLPLIMR